MHKRGVSCLVPLAVVVAARAVVAVMGVAVAGCEVATAPRGVSMSVVPVSFSAWWEEMEQCSGVAADLGRISWYEVPCEPGETGFRCEAAPDRLCGGQWRPPHVIELAGPNRVLPDGYKADEWTVKHEMLHDLLGRTDHTNPFKDCHVALR